MSDKHTVEWFEHKSILELNSWVDKYFSKSTKNEYYSLNAYCFEEFKVETVNWLDERIGMLEELKEMIEELPDDEYKEYEVDENDNHVGVPDE